MEKVICELCGYTVFVGDGASGICERCGLRAETVSDVPTKKEEETRTLAIEPKLGETAESSSVKEEPSSDDRRKRKRAASVLLRICLCLMCVAILFSALTFGLLPEIVITRAKGAIKSGNIERAYSLLLSVKDIRDVDKLLEKFEMKLVSRTYEERNFDPLISSVIDIIPTFDSLDPDSPDFTGDVFYEYDTVGNPVLRTVKYKEKTYVTKYVYSDTGLILYEITEGEGVTEYIYENGRLALISKYGEQLDYTGDYLPSGGDEVAGKPLKSRTFFEYDENGRTVKKTTYAKKNSYLLFPDVYTKYASSLDYISSSSIAYAPTDTVTEESYTYNRNGDVDKYEKHVGGELLLSIAYYYDKSGRLTTEKYTDYTVALNRNYENTYEYGANGRLSKKSVQDGVYTYKYDLADRLTKEEIEPKDSSLSHIAITYTYGKNGRLKTKKTEWKNSSYAKANATTVTYTYNSLDALIGEKTTYSIDDREIEIKYDRIIIYTP